MVYYIFDRGLVANMSKRWYSCCWPCFGGLVTVMAVSFRHRKPCELFSSIVVSMNVRSCEVYGLVPF